MKKRIKRTSTTVHSIDGLMLNIASSLIGDFRSNITDPEFCTQSLDAIRSKDISALRSIGTQLSDNLTAYHYKAVYQVESLFKRHRFASDLYSDKELEQMAIAKFRDTQCRLASLPKPGGLSASCELILDLAARFISDTLGDFDDEEHRRLCRFGKRASVGVPARMACEAARWELPISGSQNQISWFDSEMSQAADVQEYWARQKDRTGNSSTYHEVDSLSLVLVPKTFKSLRTIMPNTTVGSYMSFGLGEMMRKRLKRKGYDISTLQERHKVLAQAASIHEQWVTADLSSASDSITVALVERLFPPDWVQILHLSRIAKVSLPDGTTIDSLTYCTMGVGYTFPLQTLVFLSLLWAIETALYDRLDRRTISVYGDDMIYHRRMHDHVLFYFEKFGFVINNDKTFHEGGFRESCGGDYFRGVDVRPFQPQNGQVEVDEKVYEATLYKCLNGLLRRWDECEIGRTIKFLMSEVELITGKCKLVPGQFPDDAGLQCPTLTWWSFTKCFEVVEPKSLGHGMFRFPFLSVKNASREEQRHEPYFWLALRGPALSTSGFVDGHVPQECRGVVSRRIDDITGFTEDSRILRKKLGPPIEVPGDFIGPRFRPSITVVPIGHSGRYKRQLGISTFENRR